MHPLSRSLFPTLACFGPLFVVIGLQTGGTSYLRVLALLGALMTSVALILLFREVVRLGDARTSANRS